MIGSQQHKLTVVVAEINNKIYINRASHAPNSEPVSPKNDGNDEQSTAAKRFWQGWEEDSCQYDKNGETAKAE